MDLISPFLTTTVGSFPHADGKELSQRLAGSLDIPCWPQLPRRSFKESMYVQYSASLPAVRIDEAKEKIYFDTDGDLSADLERFYTHYLEENLDAFGLSPDYAAGFFDMLAALETTSGNWAKGQVTGPISFGLTVTDQDLRASLYNDLLADAIVKNMALNARWQIQQLKKVRSNIIIFVDEPYMAAFGSAFISLSCEQAIDMLNEVFEAIHQEGAWAGVHCCANTDWSVLLGTTVDILNLDAYGYMENLALYPAELRDFLDRDGAIAWGIVPNNAESFREEIFRSGGDQEAGQVEPISAEDLAGRLKTGIENIAQKAQARGVSLTSDELTSRSLIAPSCGLGSTTVEVADLVLEALIACRDYMERR